MGKDPGLSFTPITHIIDPITYHILLVAFMLALRYRSGQLSIADIPKPMPTHEALVRVTLSGICNTDVEIVRGYAGFEGTIGHEFVGVVESAPESSLVGRRVV